MHSAAVHFGVFVQEVLKTSVVQVGLRWCELEQEVEWTENQQEGYACFCLFPCGRKREAERGMSERSSQCQAVAYVCVTSHNRSVQSNVNLKVQKDCWVTLTAVFSKQHP